MKLSLYKLAILIAFSLNVMIAQESNYESVKFITLGNCYTCKLRIEGVIRELNGIDRALWSEADDASFVTYDKTKTNIHEIMQAIANVGHDTEWYRSPDSAYETLRGTCCEYTRTIDYSKAKIGYLSLMDMWVSVGDYENHEIHLYPNLVYNNRFIVNSLSKLDNLNLNIYDLIGNKVLSDLSLNSGENLINLNGFHTGFYFAIITDKSNRIINKSRIIVQ
jgi:copper chaperone CopZ